MSVDQGWIRAQKRERAERRLESACDDFLTAAREMAASAVEAGAAAGALKELDEDLNQVIDGMDGPISGNLVRDLVCVARGPTGLESEIADRAHGMARILAQKVRERESAGPDVDRTDAISPQRTSELVAIRPLPEGEDVVRYERLADDQAFTARMFRILLDVMVDCGVDELLGWTSTEVSLREAARRRTAVEAVARSRPDRREDDDE